MKPKDVLRQVAAMNEVSVKEISDEIQESIRAAAQNQPQVFLRAFGYGVPNVDEFLEKIVSEVIKGTCN